MMKNQDAVKKIVKESYAKIAWASSCVSGAILKQDYLDQLKKTGFVNITIHKETPAFLPDYGLSITFPAFKQ